MRKLIILTLITVLLGALYPLIEVEEGIRDETGVKPYITFYLDSPVYIEGAEISKGGIYWEMKVTLNLADEIRTKLPEIKGESITTRGNREDADEYLSDRSAQIRSEQMIEGIKFIYAYTRGIRNYVTLDGDRVNLQIALREDGIMIIGTPLILGAC